MDQSDILIAKARSAEQKTNLKTNYANKIAKFIAILMVLFLVYFGYYNLFGSGYQDRLKKQNLERLREYLINYQTNNNGLPGRTIRSWHKRFLETDYVREELTNPVTDVVYQYEVSFRNNSSNQQIINFDDYTNLIYIDPGYKCSQDGVTDDDNNIAFRVVLSNNSIYCLDYK